MFTFHILKILPHSVEKKKTKKEFVLEFVSGGCRIVEIAFVNGPSVTGGFAQDFVELVLEERPHEIADHVVIVAHMENGGDI